MEWGAFLKFLSTPDGIKMALVVAITVAAQMFWPNWKKKPLNFRLLVMTLICFAIPLLAAALGVWTEGWSPKYQATFWPALQAGGLSLAPAALAEGLKVTELADKRRKKKPVADSASS